MIWSLTGFTKKTRRRNALKKYSYTLASRMGLSVYEEKLRWIINNHDLPVEDLITRILKCKILTYTQKNIYFNIHNSEMKMSDYIDKYLKKDGNNPQCNKNHVKKNSSSEYINKFGQGNNFHYILRITRLRNFNSIHFPIVGASSEDHRSEVVC
jgi:hypothetical protein